MQIALGDGSQITTTRLLAIGAGIIAVLAVGCAEEDKTPPAAPIVDAIDSPNKLSTIQVTGTAEFGATVRVAGGGGGGGNLRRSLHRALVCRRRPRRRR